MQNTLARAVCALRIAPTYGSAFMEQGVEERCAAAATVRVRPHARIRKQATNRKHHEASAFLRVLRRAGRPAGGRGGASRPARGKGGPYTQIWVEAMLAVVAARSHPSMCTVASKQ